MPLTFEKLHPHFAAEVGPIDLRRVHDPETLAEIRAGMDEYAVLVFRDQPFADDEQIAFAQRLDGELHTKTGSSALKKSRLGNEALGDISNVDETAISCSPTTGVACTASAIASGTRTPRSRTHRAATRCCRRASSRPWTRTPSSPTRARPTTPCPPR